MDFGLSPENREIIVRHAYDPRSASRGWLRDETDLNTVMNACRRAGFAGISEDVVRLFSSPDEAAEELAKGETALAQGQADRVPGMMRCAKCSFVLVRNVLHAQSGAITAGGNETEPCPNGCGPLWPMTWRQHAEDMAARCEEQMARAVAAEASIADFEAVAKRLGQRADYLNERGDHGADEAGAAASQIREVVVRSRFGPGSEAAAARYPMPAHHNRHPWCQPGDRPDRTWMLVFDDADVRTMIWTRDDAEEEARKAYTQRSPSWNCTLFAAVPATPPINPTA